MSHLGCVRGETELLRPEEYPFRSCWRSSGVGADELGQVLPFASDRVSSHLIKFQYKSVFDTDDQLLYGSFDVGGTSTDVSRFDGKYEIVYETTTAGISIQSPQLDINTVSSHLHTAPSKRAHGVDNMDSLAKVAAGGGSCLTFRNVMFQAGPESAGAHPGPACYRKGGPLALTDGNLFLGRLVPK